jgi:regulation of enolase protein 1 (concanavalin A-like superfamily)
MGVSLLVCGGWLLSGVAEAFPAGTAVDRPLGVWWGSYRHNAQLVDAGAGEWAFVQGQMDGYLLHGAYWNYPHMTPSPEVVGPKLAAIINAAGKPVILEHLLAGQYPAIDSPFGYTFAGNLADAAGFGTAIANIRRLMGYGFPRPDISSDFIMNAWQEAVRWHPQWTREEFFTALTGSWEGYGGEQFDATPGSVDRQRYGWFRQWVERLAQAFPGIRVTATNSPVYFPWEEGGVVRRELGGSLNNFFTWLKLERRGEHVTALYSGDGHGWAELGSAVVPLGAEARAGLLAASGAAGLAEARFDQLRFQPFFVTDIGRPGRGGKVDVLNDPIGKYTLQGNGDHDLHPGNNRADAQFYAYREWTGDGAFTVRLDSLSGSNPARTNGAAEKPTAGITLRASAAADARQVSLHATLADTLEFRARTATGGGLANVSGSGSPLAGGGVASGARWLRLTRAGHTVTAAHSTDGAGWTAIGSATVDLGASFLVGLVADSQVSFERATAVFGGVSFLSAPSAAFSGATIGAAGAASSSLVSGAYTLRSAGHGVAGAGDAMRFHSAVMPGDGTLYARLQYFADAANPDLALADGAQMGLALRASTDPGAPQLAAVFTPRGGLLALARAAPGGVVAAAGGYGAGEAAIEPLGAQRRPLLHYFTGNDYLRGLHEAFPGDYRDNYAGFTTDSPYAGYQKWGGSEDHPDAIDHRRKIILYERWLHSVGRDHEFIANSAGGTDFNAFDTSTQSGRDAWDLLYKRQSLRSLQLHQLEGGRPDRVIFESWYAGPFSLVPEDKDGSFTNLVRDAILYVKGTGQALDLAVAPAGGGEFAGTGVQQLDPHGVQRVASPPGEPGSVREWVVRLRNAGDVAALPVLQAVHEATDGWGIAYAIGGEDVTAALTSPDGLVVASPAIGGQELVAPGATVDLRISLTAPESPARGSLLLRAYWNPQDPSLLHRDAVRIDLYPHTGYDAWAAGIDWNGADQHPGADPDRDGLSNLLEYAFGGDPLQPDPGLGPLPGIAGDFLRISFDRVEDPALSYTLMGSSDLSTWTSVWGSSGADNLAGRVTVTDAVPLTDARSRFLRLSILLERP